MVADSDGLARRALRDALRDAGLTVVGQAADTPQAVALATRCAPDVLVLDAELGPSGGVAAMNAVAEAAPDTRVVLLVPQPRAEGALQAATNGAVGYLPREIDLDALARAVEGVMKGEAAISRAMALRMMGRLRDMSAGLEGMRPVKSKLTTREWEVVDLLKAGASTAEIAKQLVLSTETVHSHVRHILRKLSAHSRAEAVEIAERTRVGLPTST